MVTARHSTTLYLHLYYQKVQLEITTALSLVYDEMIAEPRQDENHDGPG